MRNAVMKFSLYKTPEVQR